jgi:hypothetical protein
MAEAGIVILMVPPVPPAASPRIARGRPSTRPCVAMTSGVDLAISGFVPTPPAVGMTAIDMNLLHEVGPDDAFLKCAGNVERS